MDIKGQTVVVCGAGGFIGGHLVKNPLRNNVKVVRAVDIKPLDEWHPVSEDVENFSLNLKDKANWLVATDGVAGTRRTMKGGIDEPVNLGSNALVTVDRLVDIVKEIACIKLKGTYNLSAPEALTDETATTPKFSKNLAGNARSNCATVSRRHTAGLITKIINGAEGK